MEAYPEHQLVPSNPLRARARLARQRLALRSGARGVSAGEPHAAGAGAGSNTGESRSAALVLRARAGDRGAFGELYAAHAPMVHAVLVGMIAVREARDLVQDVFVAALDRLEQLDDPARFGAWVATIARNRARDLLRAPRPARSDDGAELEPRVLGLAARADETDDAEEAARALAALRALPEAYRETLAMRLVEGLSGRAIAERTGMTYGSVRVNLCRGMKLLRARLCGEGDEQPLYGGSGGSGGGAR